MKKKVEKRQEITNELMDAPSTSSGRQLQSLIAITNILCLPRVASFEPITLLNLRDPRLQRSLPYPQYAMFVSTFAPYDLRRPFEIYDLYRSIITRRILELYDIIDLMEIDDLLKLHYLDQQAGKSSLIKQRIKYFFFYFELSDIKDGYIYDDLFVGYDRFKADFRFIHNIANLLNRDKIISILCEIISQGISQNISYVLLALATVISTHDTISSSLIEQITDCLQSFEKLALPIGKEHHFVIEYIIQQTNKSSTSSLAPSPSIEEKEVSERVASLHKLKHSQQITKLQIDELIAALGDKRYISYEEGEELAKQGIKFKNSYVNQIAMELLIEERNFELDSLDFLVQILTDNNPMVCVIAALLLQRNKTLPRNLGNEAVQRIMMLLKDNVTKHRSLLQLDNSRFWRLDDVLFETLQVLIS